jgi:hypothetical protein
MSLLRGRRHGTNCTVQGMYKHDVELCVVVVVGSADSILYAVKPLVIASLTVRWALIFEARM